MTLVKICGITNMEDLIMCLREGVDITGFNLYPKSTRYVGISKLQELTEEAGERAALVTVDKNVEDLIQTVNSFRPGYLQLHGSENPDYMMRIRSKFPDIKLIKKVTIDMKDEFLRILQTADYLLCDVKSPLHGGTGMKFDWALLREIPPSVKKKLFVAGGVGPENVGSLSGRGLGGIDIASGSESYPGVKDPVKVKEIVRIVSQSSQEN